jgi:diguanylate cyclase (GGDEF)-like protein
VKLLSVKKSINEKRQERTFQLYRIGIAIALVLGVIAILMGKGQMSVKIQNAITISSVLIICLLILEVFRVFVKGVSRKDNAFLLINIIVYFAIVVTYKENGILPALIWSSVLLLVISSSLDKKKVLIYMLIHSGVVGYYFITISEMTIQLHAGTYISIFASSIILLYVLFQMIDLLNSYQAKMDADYKYILRKSEETTKLAYYDSLTGLYNRLGFRTILQEMIGKAQMNGTNVVANKMHLVIVDIDNFSHINNVYGYKKGDIIIKQVADKLNYLCMEHITSARISTDVLALILPRERDIKEVQKNIDEMSMKVTYDGITLNIQFNAGIASYPQHGSDAEELIGNGELALSIAKSSKESNTCVFHPSIREQFVQKVTMMQA